MSKLESFIRRMKAQRDCLNHTAKLIKNSPGVVFELGLGNGRTYDHLRQVLPDRQIYVFDRVGAPFPSCEPPSGHMFVGEIVHTLTKAEELFRGKVILVHNDLGCSNPAKNKELADTISPLLESMMLPGAVIVSNTRFHVDAWQKIPVPPGVKKDRYFLYRQTE